MATFFITFAHAGPGGIRLTTSPRRKLVFRFRGEYRSPILQLVARRPALHVAIEPTNLSRESATELVRIQGPEDDLADVRRLLGASDPGTSVTLLETDREVAFFQTSPRTRDGAPTFEHLVRESLGEAATLRAEFGSAGGRVVVTAPAEARLADCYRAFHAILETRFEVELERLSPEAPPRSRHVTLERDDLLLGALLSGDLDADSEERLPAPLRGALADLVAACVADPPSRSKLAFQTWGAPSPIPHHAFLLSRPRLHASTEETHTTKERVRSIMIVDGPPADLGELARAVEAGPATKGATVEIIARTKDQLVLLETMERGVADESEVLLEHALFDRTGPAGLMRTQFHRGIRRVSCVADPDALDGFWTQTCARLGMRYEVARTVLDEGSFATLRDMHEAATLARDDPLPAAHRLALRNAVLACVPGAIASVQARDSGAAYARTG